MLTFYLVPTRPGKTEGVKGYRAEGSVASWAEEQGSLVHMQPCSNHGPASRATD